MTDTRSGMTLRMVPLAHGAAGAPPAPATAAERVALTVELSALAWSLSGKPWPRYDRHTMPVRVKPLRER